jgi:hypothetical protein
VIFNQGLGPQAGFNQSKERRNRYAQFSPFSRRLLKDSITWEFSGERYDGTSTPLLNFGGPPPPRGVVGAPPAGSSRILSLGGPLP